MNQALEIIDALLERLTKNDLSDGIGVLVPAQKQKANSKEHWEYVLQTNVEKWYPLIAHLTFTSHWIPLTMDEAKEMIELYSGQLNIKEHFSLEAAFSWMSEEIKDKLKTLTNKLDEAMDIKKHYFCKLSTRSPKDVFIKGYYTDNNEKSLKHLFIECMNDGRYNLDKSSLNDKKIGIEQACVNILKCANSMDVMLLLIQSKRIYDDLMNDINACESDKSGKKIFNQSIILREWDDNLFVMNEFRGFVYNNQLTAISQYHDNIRHSKIVDNKENIQKYIFNYWKKYCKQPLSKLGIDYIVDFVILKDSHDLDVKEEDNQESNIKVIELNAFADDTGPLLFSWQSDRHILCNTQNVSQETFQPQIRVQTLEFDECNLRELFENQRELIKLKL